MKKRRLWKVIPFALVLALLPLQPASACSCFIGDLRDRFDESDGAIIGTYLERRPVDPTDTFGDHYYTFRVDESLKGEFGDTIDVRASGNGASCGIEAVEGEQYGLFLDAQDSEWHSSLCSQVSPDQMREAASPLPEPTSTDPVRLLAGGSFGDAQSMGLDARGRTVGYGFGDRDVALTDVCPGGERAIEVGAKYPHGQVLTVRDLGTFEAVRNVPLPVGEGRRFGARFGIRSIACRGPAARTSLLFVTSYGKTPDSALLSVHGRDVNVERRGDGTAAALDGHTIFIAQGAWGRKVVSYDMDTGRERFIAEVPGDYVADLSVSPTGEYLGGVSNPQYGSDDEPSMEVWVVSLRDRVRVASRTFRSTWDGGSVAWWRARRLVAFGWYGAKSRVVTPRLRTVGTFESWYGREGALLGRHAWGVSWDGLFRVALPDGAARRVRRLPSPTGYTISSVAR